MFTLDTVAGKRTGVMSRLFTTLNTLTVVKQSSCYYALVKTVETLIQSPFGFVWTRHVKAHGEEHRRNIQWTLKCWPSSKSLIQSPYTHNQLFPLNFFPPLSSYWTSRASGAVFSYLLTSQINVYNALKDPEFRVAHCLCPKCAPQNISGVRVREKVGWCTAGQLRELH